VRTESGESIHSVGKIRTSKVLQIYRNMTRLLASSNGMADARLTFRMVIALVRLRLRRAVVQFLVMQKVL
jgi:hypothetical protein